MSKATILNPRVFGKLATSGMVCALVLATASCGAGSKPYVSPDAPLRDRPNVALLPLEDLTGRPEVASKITRIFFAELVRTQVCEVIEMGESEAAVRRTRIRNTGSLTNEQIQELGQELGARFLMAGTVLEAGTITTSRGTVPALGVALKLIDVQTTRVVWADVRNRTGDDHETVFGWGREHSPEQLAIDTAVEMFESLQQLATPPKKEGGKS